jgi:hypothetical protein
MTDRKNGKKSDSSAMEIGGGAINEKERTFQQPGNSSTGFENNESSTSSSSPYNSSNRCHLMHAIEGLDRYPIVH